MSDKSTGIIRLGGGIVASIVVIVLAVLFWVGIGFIVTKVAGYFGSFLLGLGMGAYLMREYMKA